MKLTIVTGETPNDELPWDSVTIDDSDDPAYTAWPLCECPEDAFVGRSLLSAERVANLMKLAHAAGARGEPFEVVTREATAEDLD